MFKELAPYLRQRAVLLTVTHIEDDQIRVNVIPQKLKDSENAALMTPLTVTGTAGDLDRDLPATLADFVSVHFQLRSTLDRAKAEMDAAAKGSARGSPFQEQDGNNKSSAEAGTGQRRRDRATCFLRPLRGLREPLASSTQLSRRPAPVWTRKRKFLPIAVENSARTKRTWTKLANRIDPRNSAQ
jgi:PRTRC genetic system protein E